MKLRSLLFVPGDRPERMEKALGLGADALILDLEDAVAPGKKDEARAAVSTFLFQNTVRPELVEGLPSFTELPKGKGGLRQAQPERSLGQGPYLFVRINPLDSGMAEADLDAAAGADGIVLPKSEGPGSLSWLDSLLERRGSDAVILPIVTETPAAIFTTGSYGDVTERLIGLTWGAEDLPAAIGAESSREADGRYTPPYEFARSLTLFGAHAAGVAAIETVYPDFRDLEGLAAYAARGARDGFTGMMAIHPAQIEPINRAFTPSAEAVAKARAIVAAFEANPGAGVLALDGKMVDLPHLKAARRIIERAG